MKENDKISIIIPVYNVELYLERCVKSLLEQTYSNIEIILVDDGSKDSSGKMCDDLAKIDKRIVVIHKKNGGQSDARNFALEQMTGTYVTFVDSDDYVDKDYIEFLYKMLKRDSSQISICSYKAVYDSGAIITQENNKEYCLSPHDAIEKTLYHEDFNVSVWAKMYKATFFKTVRFPVGKIFEEVETMYKLFVQAEKISVCLKSKYNYMIRENSTLTGAFSEKKLYLTTAYANMGNEVLKIFPDLDKAVIRANVYAHISTLRQIIFVSPRMKNIETELRKYVLNNYKSIFVNSRVAMRDKIACVLILFGNNCFKIGWKFYCKLTGRVYL